jgi:hypothetical protein
MHKTSRVPLLALILVPACAHSPVYQSSGPSIRDGVKVAIVGRSCDQYHDPNFEFDDFVGLDLDLEVRNATDAPLTRTGSDTSGGFPSTATRAQRLGATAVIDELPAETNLWEILRKATRDSHVEASSRADGSQLAANEPAIRTF